MESCVQVGQGSSTCNALIRLECIRIFGQMRAASQVSSALSGLRNVGVVIFRLFALRLAQLGSSMLFVVGLGSQLTFDPASLLWRRVAHLQVARIQ